MPTATASTHRRETLERVLDGIYLDAGVVIDFNVSVETRDAAKNFAALVKRAASRRTRSRCARPQSARRHGGDR